MRALPLLLVATALAACEQPVAPPVEPPFTCGGGSASCRDDRNCNGGFCAFAEADDTVGCCHPIDCFGDDECPDGTPCNLRRGSCGDGNQLCNPGDQSGCSDGQLCTFVQGDPECVDTAPPPVACAITAGGRRIDDGSGVLAPAVISAGTELQLEATGFKADGSLSPFASFTFSSTGAAVSSSGLFTGACVGVNVCGALITATDGAATCTGVVRVHPNINPGESRIVVLDLASGQPIVGAVVAANLGAGLVDDVTDATGAAIFDGIAANMSAFPIDHQWTTVIDPPRDLIVFVASVPFATRVAGIKGTLDFDHVSTSGDIKIGFAGTAIASSIADLDFTQILGEVADFNVELEGVTEPGGELVALPSGLVLKLGDEDIKGDYVAFGTPGPNVGWAIGGRLALAKVGPIISKLTGSDDVNTGDIVGAVLPFFATFDHALVSNLTALTTQPRPAAPGDRVPVPFDQWPFNEIEMQLNTLASLAVNYTLPNLPCAAGRGVSPTCDATGLDASVSPFATRVLAVAGVVVPGIGLVPLGLTAALDDFDADDGNDFDGTVDTDPEAIGAPGRGRIILEHSPPHDGLEGNEMMAVAIALDAFPLAADDIAGISGASVVTELTPSFGTGQRTFPAGTFLERQGGSFSPVAGTFAIQAVGEADFYRVKFVNDAHAEWSVFFTDPTAAIDTAALHPVDVDASARVVHADVEAFRLGAGYPNTPEDFAALFAFDGENTDAFMHYLGAWSREPCGFAGFCEDVDAPDGT